MRIYSRWFLPLACFFMLFLSVAKDESLAACLPPAKIVGYSYNPTSIQDAYDYASTTLALTDFTLQLSGEIFTEDLLLNGGTVAFDGGYDCTFATKIPTPTGLFGRITVAGGAAEFAGGVNIVSTSACAFDGDLDGYSSVGSCSGSADDCNDKDAGINPGAAEICDGIDNNCDGQIDEGTIPTDADGDGYYAVGSCGGSPFTDDCNDADGTINPGALDIPYDGVDQDCSGADLTFSAVNSGVNCTWCHGAETTWNAMHALVTTPDTSCAVCHAGSVGNILPGHYGDTVLTAGNNLSAGAVINCTSCHDMDGATYHPAGGALGSATNFVWSKVDPVKGSVTCDTCHESRAAGHMTATAHNRRAIDATCGTCHTSDTTAVGIPGTGTLTSAADVDALHRSDCALCHNYSGTILNAAVVRQVIEQGVSGPQVSCLDCHTDKATGHSSREHNVAVGLADLSYDAPGLPCSSCHMVSTWAEIEAVEHNVATNGAGSCATCHNSPRQDVRAAITAGADPTNCLDCHSDKLLLVHGNVDHVALGYVTGGITTCLNCHATGAAENGTVLTTHKSNCFLCHTNVPALQPGLPAGGGVCIDCHVNTWTATHTSNPPSHNSLVQVAATACGDCHSEPPPLTDAGDSKVHNACGSCHDANGGLLGLAVGQNFTTGGDCATCHTGTWEVTHTVAPNHGMIVTVIGTDCGSCHDDTLVSAAANTHKRCTTCHNADTGALISFAAGKSAPGNCTTCHADPWEATHTTNAPDHSSLVQVATTGCASCHDNTLTSAAANTHNGCVSCHNADGSLRSLAIGRDFTTGGDCSSCHTNSWATIHTLAPDHTALVTVSGVTCANCHDNTLVGVQSHFACTTCHDTNSGVLISLAAGKDFTTGGNCISCHTNSWEATHAGNPPDHTLLVQLATTSCASCHSDPPPLTDAGDPKVHNACTTCHNASSGALISFASGKTFAAGGDCATCHTGSWESIHTTAPDHSGIVNVATFICADCHSNPPPLTDAGDPKVHNACTSCHNASTGALLGIAFGKSAPGTCVNCHGNDVKIVHPDCSSCHGEPPNGSSSPNRERAHAEHDVLGYGSVSPRCSACHSGAPHADGATQVSISSSFDDQSSGTPSFDGSSCVNVRCHGGQPTPSWSADSLDVSTQCSSCHAEGTAEYNSYNSGRHSSHLGGGRHWGGSAIKCWDCHNTGKLTGHFTNLQTTTFEQDPATTIGGGSTRVGSYDGATCSNIECHRSRTWDGGGGGH